MTEPFTTFELENWRETLDFLKIGRQLQNARQQMPRDEVGLPLKPNRARLLDALGRIYALIETGEYDAARTTFRGLEMFLREAFGWYGVDNTSTPRPLDKPYLNRLYWDASRVLLGDTKPKPLGNANWKFFSQRGRAEKWSDYTPPTGRRA